MPRTIVGTLLLTIMRASAQEAPPQFEVASIKPAPPPTGRGMRVSSRGGPGTEDPGIFICENCAVSGLIARAFDIQDYQLSGPDWMQSARFDISARIPAGVTKAQFRLMIQDLLADRFKMTFHRSTKEMSMFNLVVAKNGPRFKEAVEAPPSDDPPRRGGGPMKTGPDGFPVLGPGGKGFSMAIMNNRAALSTGGGTIEEFALNISNQLRQPVKDATGLKGKYEISMHWVPGDPPPDDPGPSLFQALQDQLGLKLESKKGTVETIVIDHLEKIPSEN